MFRTTEEEKFNALSHLVSSLVCLCTFFIINYRQNLNLSQTLILFFLFSFSSWAFYSSYLYHSHEKIVKKIQNRFVDKVGIYFLIMSTGLCFTLVTQNRDFIILNSLAIIASTCWLILKLCLEGDKNETFSLASYIILGWFCIMPVTGVFIKTVFIEEPQFTLLISGTAMYLIGVIFYVLDRIKWFHGVWHIASFLGFLFHCLSIIYAANIF